MKGFIRFIVVCFISSMFTSAWALATKFDPNIFVNELKTAGVRNVAKVQSDLGLDGNSNAKQELLVKHVITTGRNQADQNYILVDIATLEKIRPPVSAYNIITQGKQVALTEEQVQSVTNLIQADDTTQGWLTDKSKPKYINIVLQNKDSSDNKISPVSTSEAGNLVRWAIRNKRLERGDHPTKAPA